MSPLGVGPASATGKFLAPHAGKLAAALARRITYRWRVERAVRRRTGSVYSARHFRSWLKVIPQSDLELPVEQGGARLARNLNDWLASRDPAWAHGQYRLSQAARLVEAAYVVLLKEMDGGAAQQLQAEWHRRRHEELILLLGEVSGGDAPLSGPDMAVWLRRRSRERRRVRLAAFDVDMQVVEESIASCGELITTVPAGEVRVLVGAFGAGKSEVAEEWHRSCIATALDAADDASTRVPAWLHAREASAVGLERAVRDLVGRKTLLDRGVALVVDGLDEVHSATAEALSRDARVLVAGDRRSSVLLTCRLGVLPPSDEDIMAPGLSEEAARALVERLAGVTRTWDWSAGLIETIKRPFFALAAGSQLAKQQAPAGQVELMTRLVEQALARASSAGAFTSADAYEALLSLGVTTTTTNGATDGLDLGRRQVALTTRLVSGDPRGGISFALPIFQHWFAAQALLRETGLVDDALSGAAAFDRWRWAFAMAVSGAPIEVADALLERCLRFNPGAGAWIVDQVSEKRLLFRAEGSVLEPDEARKRLLLATRAWVDGLDELAPYVLWVQKAKEPIRLGVGVGGSRVSVAWGRAVAVEDEVVSLTPAQLDSDDWAWEWSGSVPAGSHWPWVAIRDNIAGRTLKLLEGPDRLGPADGLWHHERRYRTARAVIRDHSVFHKPMGRTEVIEAADLLLGPQRERLHALFSLDTRVVSGEELADLLDWLEEQTFGEFVRPVPAPDVMTPTGAWVWDVYSPPQLARFCAETYGLGIVAYEEMADTVFSSFGWSLSLSAFRPVGVLGTVVLPEPSGIGPVLEYQELPMDLLREAVLQDDAYVLSANGRAAMKVGDLRGQHHERNDRLSQWIGLHGAEVPFRSLSSGSTVIELGLDRPVSARAARWIWRDLGRFRLANGTFPQLR